MLEISDRVAVRGGLATTLTSERPRKLTLFALVWFGIGLFGAAAHYVILVLVAETIGAPVLAAATVGASINWLIIAWLLDHTAVPYLVVQVGATAAVQLRNFTANRLWTFRT